MNSETPEPEKTRKIFGGWNEEAECTGVLPVNNKADCKSLLPVPPAPEPSVVPYNPGLHELVEGKKAGAEPLDAAAREQGFCGWHQRGYLPHHDVPGVTQFVTFRLADALPASRRSEWEALLKIESERQRRMELEAYLDRGAGECWLARPEIAAVAESALRYFEAGGIGCRHGW